MSLIRVKAFHYEGKEMKALDDNRIVDLYLSRDEAAISQTSEKYGSRLRNVAYGIVEDLHTAEECENDTYMEAWNSIPPHEPKSYLFAFLARITRHIALDFCKERSRLKRSAFISELSAEMEQCIPAPDDTERRIGAMVLCEAINSFLATLSDEKRNIFMRRYWYMDSIAAISQRYGLSQSKVKSILFRSRNQLREYLGSRIVELYWQKNADAIKETDSKYGAYCFAIADNILHKKEDSEECVNDTWLNAWNAMPPQKPTKLQMFLAKITRNLSFNRFNARSAEKRGGGEVVLVLDELAECLAGESDVEGEYEARELGQCIRMFVRALPERDGNVFVRRYFFTEPVAEIAKRYGLTDNNVMVILSRTRKKLKVHLIKEGFFSE